MNDSQKIPGRVRDRFREIWQNLTHAHPSILETGERRRAQLLSILSFTLTIPLILGLLARPRSFVVFLVFLAITLASYYFSRTKYYSVGTAIFVYGFTAIAYLRIYQGASISIESAVTTTVHLFLVIGSVLLSQRAFVLFAILNTIATFSAPLYSHTSIALTEGASRTGGLVLTIGLVLIGINAYRASVERERLRETHEINRNLEDLTANLEKRVAERTEELASAKAQTEIRAGQLQTITELSETIATFQDLDQLFSATTKLISERFGFYHVGIFLIDEAGEFAVLQSANSEGGHRMLARSHRLHLGTGVVGVCAESGRPRIALDTGADAVYFDNPDLPMTRSEAALPLKSRGKTIGVLDVQSLEPGAFTSEDLQVLTTLANQVSITLENARLLTETRAALAQVQEVYDEFTRAEWSRTVSKAEQPGFRYHIGRIELLENALDLPEVVSAVQSGQIEPSLDSGVAEKRTQVAVPVKIRGEVIGIIHVESNDSSKVWKDDEITLVQAVAERAALAMENARLFQDARRRAAKEQAISQATTRISRAINIENILHTTAEELERVLGGSEVLIRFQDKERS